MKGQRQPVAVTTARTVFLFNQLPMGTVVPYLLGHVSLTMGGQNPPSLEGGCPLSSPQPLNRRGRWRVRRRKRQSLRTSSTPSKPSRRPNGSPRVILPLGPGSLGGKWAAFATFAYDRLCVRFSPWLTP